LAAFLWVVTFGGFKLGSPAHMVPSSKGYASALFGSR
jgi:hypothetical protein